MRVEVRSDESCRQFEGEGISPSMQTDVGRLVAQRVIALIERSGTTDVSTVAIGTTTELGAAELASVQFLLSERFPRADLLVGDDGTVAHAAFLGGEGTLLSVGTGVIAVAVSARGGIRRFDGWGPLAGDRGSAAEVGRQGLVEAMRAIDHGQAATLREAAEKHFGPLTVELMRQLCGPAWPRKVASFAPEVCSAAQRGDPIAQRILEGAARELTETCCLAALSAESEAVVVHGRFGTNEPMSSLLRVALGGAGLKMSVAGDMIASLDPNTLLVDPYKSALALSFQPGSNS